MPVRAGSHHGTTDDTTHVVCVPAPPRGTVRMVKSILVHNGDGSPQTVLLKKVILDPEGGVTRYTFHRETLTTLTNLAFTALVVLDGPKERIEMVLTGATTIELDFATSWGDQT